jgi:two-component system sensor histidine kinase/response regulator
VLSTDRRSLNQILINLANNAIKFTDDGSVRLRLEHDGNGEGATVTRFHVIDTGAGIADADQEKLFKAFERIEVMRSRHFEGTGLGLYISDKLAGLIHGQITFESRPGHGSTFTLELTQ